MKPLIYLPMVSRLGRSRSRLHLDSMLANDGFAGLSCMLFEKKERKKRAVRFTI